MTQECSNHKQAIAGARTNLPKTVRHIPDRQIETSVMLADERWRARPTA